VRPCSCFNPFHIQKSVVLSYRNTLQIASAHSTPLFTASIRLIPAGLIVIAWAASRGRPWPSGTQAWAAILLFGAVDGTLFQGFLSEGLEKVPAGIGSVIIDSQPLTVALVAALVFGESLSRAGVLGLFLGLFGLLLLEVPLATLESWTNLDLGAVAIIDMYPSCFLLLVHMCWKGWCKASWAQSHLTSSDTFLLSSQIL
jgi:drug/metabolite transporter (DMT)-like permease